MKTLRAGVLVALGCFALAAPASAAIVSCGDVITTSITVSNDLSDCAGDGLVVGSSNITIDLAYHTIDGTGNGGGINNTAGHSNVVVRRGTVKEFAFGVIAFGQTGGRYELLSLAANQHGAYLEAPSGVRMARNTATGNGSNGLVVQNGSVVVDRGDYSRNGFVGVNLSNADGSRVTDARAADNIVAGVGLQHGTDNAVVEWVDATSNGDPSSSNCQCGIAVVNSANAVLRDNDANDNRFYGIVAAGATPGLQVLANNAHRNGSDGIHIASSGNPLLEDNDTNDNAGLGINVLTPAVNGGNNDASGNGNPAECNPATFCE